jgi:hypothetical protein
MGIAIAIKMDMDKFLDISFWSTITIGVTLSLIQNI